MRNHFSFHRCCRAGLWLLWVIALLSCSRAFPEGLDTWYLRHPFGQVSGIQRLGFGNGLFVGVGDAGTIAVSPDGRTWNQTGSGVGSTLRAVCHGNGQYVAVGDFGTVLTSVDAIDWQIQDSGIFNDLYGIAYGNGIYVSVGANSQILVSRDGDSWTDVLHGSKALRDVKFCNGVFVAAGPNAILSSSNGLNWAVCSEPAVMLAELAWDGQSYVTAGLQSSSGVAVLDSPDLRTWHSNYVELPRYSVTYSAFPVYGNGTIVIAAGSNVCSSTDLKTWTIQQPGTAYIKTMAFGNGLFVGIGSVGEALTSADGVTWTNHGILSRDQFQSIAYGGGLFVVFGRTNILTSADGIMWSQQHVPTNAAYLRTVVRAGDSFFGLADPGLVLTSADGTNWEAMSIGEGFDFIDVTYGSNGFVALSEHSILYHSQNGLDWQAVISTNVTLHNLTYNAGLYLALCQRGEYYGASWRVSVSQDGLVWTNSSMVTSYQNFAAALAYGNGRYVVCRDDYVCCSTNGVDWVYTWMGAYGRFTALIFQNGLFVGNYSASGRNLIVSSSNGIDWAIDYQLGEAPSAIGFGAGTFVAVGGSAIYQSAPVATLAPGIAHQPSGQRMLDGESVTLAAEIMGTAPFHFQWFKDGQTIPGAESSSLILTNLRASDAGSYWVVVSNTFGSVTSSVAVVAVDSPEPGLAMRNYAGLEVTGTIGRSYRIDCVDALDGTNNWQPLATFALPSSPYVWIDLQSPSRPKRFYRAQLVQ